MFYASKIGLGLAQQSMQFL